MKTILYIVFLFASDAFYAQYGNIKGSVWNEEYDEPAIFIAVTLSNGAEVYRCVTDVEGNYYFKAIPPGTYTLSFSHDGRTTKGTDPIVVSADKITFVPEQRLMPEIRPCVCYMSPPYQTPENPILTRKEVLQSVNKFQLAELAEGMSSKWSESSGVLSIRGGTNNQLQFIDGVKTREMVALPSASIRRVMIYDGFIPANYGDVIGAVIVTETVGYFDLLMERGNW